MRKMIKTVFVILFLIIILIIGIVLVSKDIKEGYLLIEISLLLSIIYSIFTLCFFYYWSYTN